MSLQCESDSYVGTFGDLGVLIPGVISSALWMSQLRPVDSLPSREESGHGACKSAAAHRVRVHHTTRCLASWQKAGVANTAFWILATVWLSY